MRKALLRRYLNSVGIKNKFIITCIFAFLTAFALTEQTSRATSSYILIHDGDTFVLNGERIRLWGIDAPELKQICKLSNQPYKCGVKAKDALNVALSGSNVECSKVSTDKYGRTVARCSIDGADLGNKMVSEGWALDYHRYSKGFYSRSQQKAEKQKIGLWSGTFEKPWEFRKR